MQPLQALGLSAAAEQTYLDLVEAGACTPADLAARLRFTDEELTAALAELSEIGLVEHTEGTIIPAPPRLAMETLADRHTQEAALARQSAELLSQLWARGVAGRTDFELLPSAEAGRAVLDSIQADARNQVRAMTLGNLSTEDHKIVDGLFDALARGVSYQVIYGAHVLHDAESLDMVRRCVAAGEQARVFPHVPMNVAIVDDRWALVTARAQTAGKPHIAAVVVHDSPFLSGLVGFFEAFWRMAVPITNSTEASGTPQRETRQLLTYLSAGLTDEAIARELGVSERTIARRISRLQEVLGAQTRFQLGVQASRQGWL
ncbi:LuxR C-terminal-related transcriptional regulator [Lentzea sp. JNUCC 0626]|uniref:helix-turn-helix transcriptional regulator n=1 Tax=Lentzea sp. JNUCC 0626 TaxID=3367513 RepID=UPI003749D009